MKPRVLGLYEGIPPMQAPPWAQPFLDCCDGLMVHGLGEGRVRIDMFRNSGLGRDGPVGSVTLDLEGLTI